MEKIECEFCDFVTSNAKLWKAHQLKDHGNYSPWISSNKLSESLKKDLIYLEALIESLGFLCQGPGLDLWEQVQNRYASIIHQLLGHETT